MHIYYTCCQFLCFENAFLNKVFKKMLITISQAKKCGWETWFTMKYGADPSKLRTPVFAQRAVDIEKALEKAESDLKKAVEMLGKTPKINSPSSKYHAQRTIDVKDQEQMIEFLRELAVPPEVPKIEIPMSKGPKQKPHSSSVLCSHKAYHFIR